MAFSKLISRAAILAIAVVLFTLQVSAHADTYQILALQTDNDHNLFGIDTAGDVVISTGSLECHTLGPLVDFCYETYIGGVLSSLSATIPSLAYDDGTPCVPSLPAGVFAFSHGVCNNGREAFESGTGGSAPPGLYTGPDVADFLHGPLADTIFMNASGDIAFSDSSNEEIYEAVDLSTEVTPEPRTLVLLATGVLGLGALRRRFVR